MFNAMIDRVWVNRSAKRYWRAAVYTASAMPMTVDRIVDSSTSWALTPIRKRDLAVDGLSDRRVPPIPVQHYVAEPVPPAHDQRGLRAQVVLRERPVDLLGRARRPQLQVVRPRVQEPVGQEVGQVRGQHDHERPADDPSGQVSQHASIIDEPTDGGRETAQAGPTPSPAHTWVQE